MRIGTLVAKFITLFVLALSAGSSIASTVSISINTDAAKSILEALQDSRLSHEESLRIAAMPGNQGIIRKTREFGFDATTQNFADALYASAHGETTNDRVAQSYDFDALKSRVAQLLAFIDQITARPDTFERVMAERIEEFTPKDADLHLQGYVVAGGDGGGYAFGGTDFYLNVRYEDEFVTARVNTTHELYHAVQGAFATSRGGMGDLPTLKGMSQTQQACMKTRQLFASVYEEGSATYVEDIAQLQTSHSETAMRQSADLTDGIRHARTAASLLEMSVLAFSASDPMDFDEVYDVDFFGHGVLYNIGCVMAKGIVDQDGPSGLAAFLKLPPEKFILRYTQLSAYGKDRDHPKLGPDTIQAARLTLRGCSF